MARASDPARPRRQPRRWPSQAQRLRDPERTRERILQAALVEFGDHGFAGARVRQIAARAGVNEQLIAYYFGGKAGLYQALATRWESVGAQLARPELALGEVVVNFFRASRDSPAWTRLLLWQGLADERSAAAEPSQPDPFMQQMVADLRRRQAAGELAPDLDPASLLLALFAAACAPLMLPQMVRRICGLAPSSEAFAAQYAKLLAGLAQHLSAWPR